MKGTRIIVHEHLDERELPVREAAPTELTEWRGCGAERGEYEAAVEVEYLRPTRRGFACILPPGASFTGTHASAAPIYRQGRLP